MDNVIYFVGDKNNIFVGFDLQVLVWCFWQFYFLVSGGGIVDRYIRFWNCSTGQCVDSVDIKLQVSGYIVFYLFIQVNFYQVIKDECIGFRVQLYQVKYCSIDKFYCYIEMGNNLIFNFKFKYEN